VFPSARLGASRISRHESRRRVKPARQDDAVTEGRRLLPEDQENGLRHILGEVRVAYLPPCCGVNEVNVPHDQFCERSWRTRPRQLPQQRVISAKASSSSSGRASITLIMSAHLDG
jgi:hypothetical protein